MNDPVAYEIIAPVAGSPGANILILADHASNHVPVHIDLGLAPGLLDQHIAIDIGVAAVTRWLCASLGCGAVLAAVSRLVIDFNREQDAAGLIPLVSDGIAIPGNVRADAKVRLEAYHRPYHAAIARAVNQIERPFLLSLHSFTPHLASRPDEQRPWDIGVLYNRDDRAARIAIPLLRAAGLNVGDQLPYSGTVLNATMNQHAEANDIAYIGVEMRQDHVCTDMGARRIAAILAQVLLICSNSLA